MVLKTNSLIIAFSLFAMLLNAQSNLTFVEAKTLGDTKTVYFQIAGLDEDKSDRDELLNYLTSDPNILKGEIFTSSANKTRCQLFLPTHIEAEYIRSLLQSNGYDFEFTSVSVNGKLSKEKTSSSFVSKHYLPAKDFPTPQKTNNKENDDLQYKLAKEQWIDSNRRKYKKARKNGTAEYPIIISREQFNSFTDEKKNKILENSEMFEIR